MVFDRDGAVPLTCGKEDFRMMEYNNRHVGHYTDSQNKNNRQGGSGVQHVRNIVRQVNDEGERRLEFIRRLEPHQTKYGTLLHLLCSMPMPSNNSTEDVKHTETDWLCRNPCRVTSGSAPENAGNKMHRSQQREALNVT